MNLLPPSSPLEDRCPMCGAKLGFSRMRCMACGESLVETDESPATYEDNLALRARRSARITGFFIALLGALLAFLGTGLLWSELSEADSGKLALPIGISITGLCWLIGGVMIFRGRAMGYWFVQPINIALIVAQLFRLDKFNVFLFALIVVFAVLCQHTRKLLREAGTLK